jgi:transposase
VTNLSTYLGLDVHKETIAVAIADGRSSDVRFYGRINNAPVAVAGMLKRLGGRYGKLCVVYEAGRCRGRVESKSSALARQSELWPPRSADHVPELPHAMDQAIDRRDSLDRQIAELVREWSLGPVVEALQALRGIAIAVAAGVVAEVGDMRRFDNPRQLMAYLGLIPGERSSGQTRRLTSITKAGSTVARRLIVEAAWSYRMPAKNRAGDAQAPTGVANRGS